MCHRLLVRFPCTFILGFLLAIQLGGCGTGDQASTIWAEVRRGGFVPIQRIEQNLEPPVEVSPLDEHTEHRVYHTKGETEALVVIVDKDSGNAVAEWVVTPNSQAIWTLYDAICKGDKITIKHIEESIGPAIAVTSFGAGRERRTYRETIKERVLIVIVDRKSQVAIQAEIVTPYATRRIAPRTGGKGTEKEGRKRDGKGDGKGDITDFGKTGKQTESESFD